jgi:hypothetical protein
MNAVLLEGVVGIVTGIVTTALLYLVKIMWDEKISPFLASIRYQGVQVGGAWLSELNEAAPQADHPEVASGEVSYKANLFLIQNAHEVQGTFVFKFNGPTNNFTLNFQVKGQLWEGYLVLNFSPRDKRITSYATSLLKLHGGGVSLVGQYCFRDVNNESVIALPMVLSREDDITGQNQKTKK